MSMTAQERTTQDITRTTLAVLFIGILITASFWILRPFLTSMVWALVIVLATWPFLLRLQRWLWGKRGLAIAVMTVILLMVVMVPLIFTISAIVGKVDSIASGIKSMGAFTIPQPPAWVSTLPIGGRKITGLWQHYASLPPEDLAALVAPYARIVLNWFMAQAGSLAAIMLQFLLTVIIAAVMYAGGETAAAGVIAFGRRLAGQHGEGVIILAGKAVRSVALGVVVTALVQTTLGGAGLFICGIPGAPLLTAVVFVLCLAQLGPILVLLPSVIWIYWKGEPFWGTVLLIFMIVANTIDNFLRPVLIKKGVDLPLIMIFAGVIGGLISFGAIGLFIGPVMLAVTYTLLKSWVYGGGEPLPSDAG
jgi:predicted PurR-regulated permease PerM